MNCHSSKRRITAGFHSLTAQLVFLFLFFLSGGGEGIRFGSHLKLVEQDRFQSV